MSKRYQIVARHGDPGFESIDCLISVDGPVAELEENEFILNKNQYFPLTKEEASLLYDALRDHWFKRDHPYYHYASGVLERMKRFIGGGE